MTSEHCLRQADRVWKLRRAAWKIVSAHILLGALAAGAGLGGSAVFAQTAPANKQLGTVKTVSPNKLTLSTDAGIVCAVNVVNEAKVLQLSPGSTDLKSAKVIALGDIEVGDRVLVTGHADAADAFTASRVILMKSTDIAQKNDAEQADWQKRGMGGLVSALDASAQTIAVTSRGKTISIKTTPSTTYKRYAGDSVRFQDTVPGTFGQIQVGDQLRTRGAPSGDGTTFDAEEIVSGSFRNLAGTIVSIDLATDKVTLKDLATKKTYSIQLTANSSVRLLPPEAAARFAARARGAAGRVAESGAAAPNGTGASKPSASVAGNPATPSPGGLAAGSAQGSAGMDLSQMLGRLPQGSLKDLHAGDALMVVASQPQEGNISLTAITLLSGVEPILAATPSGSPSMTLSPWNVGGPDSGGA